MGHNSLETSNKFRNTIQNNTDQCTEASNYKGDGEEESRKVKRKLLMGVMKYRELRDS